MNCRQYYNSNPEANAKAYSGLAVSLGTGGDTTAVSSVITPPVLTTGSVTETATLLTVEPKVVSFNLCIMHFSVEFWTQTGIFFVCLFYSNLSNVFRFRFLMVYLMVFGDRLGLNAFQTGS